MARELASPGFVLNVQVEPDSVRAAFLRRAFSALERISSTVSAKTLTEALAASSDIGSLARLLSRSDVVGPAVIDLDPLAPALARSVEHRQRLLGLAGGAASAGEAGQALGISRQAVDKRRKAGTLLAIREAGDWRYPLCQFTNGDVVPGIADVVRGFATEGPWSALDFLLAADATLGGQSPLQALLAGDRQGVQRLIRANQGDGFA
jgi:hypothetical protein